MEGKVVVMSSNLETEVKSVKCSMCRKVKTSDHFINPNSETLYHVCDNCRYLRKTKYKKRRVRVELERPSSSLSRNRESNGLRSTRNSSSAKGYSAPSSFTSKKEGSNEKLPQKPSFACVVPSRNWIEISDASQTDCVSRNKVCCLSDARYTLHHPYYRYQEILSTICTPPQVVYNSNEESFTVLPLSIPPPPQALIFCCKSSAYGNCFAFYDRLWMSQSQ